MSTADHTHRQPATGGQPRRARRMSIRTGLRLGVATIASGALATTAALSLTASASASTQAANGTAGYHFSTLNNAGDPTFNQLLGINNLDKIAGYFGSGAKGHPNMGYRIKPPTSRATTPARTSPARCRRRSPA